MQTRSEVFPLPCCVSANIREMGRDGSMTLLDVCRFSCYTAALLQMRRDPGKAKQQMERMTALYLGFAVIRHVRDLWRRQVH